MRWKTPPKHSLHLVLAEEKEPPADEEFDLLKAEFNNNNAPFDPVVLDNANTLFLGDAALDKREEELLLLDRYGLVLASHTLCLKDPGAMVQYLSFLNSCLKISIQNLKMRLYRIAVHSVLRSTTYS